MKKTTLSLLSVALLAISSVATAAEAATKIGVVDVRQILQKSPQMTALNQQLEKQFKPRQDKIAEAQKVLQADIDKLNKDGATMSPADNNQLKNKIITERADLQGMAGLFQQDLSNAQNQGMQKILAEASAVINKIGKDGDYTLIVSKDVALYAKPDLEITSQVSQAFNGAADKGGAKK